MSITDVYGHFQSVVRWHLRLTVDKNVNSSDGLAKRLGFFNFNMLETFVDIHDKLFYIRNRLPDKEILSHLS